MIAAKSTIGEIAARQPGTIRIFQAYGIDFCCGGGRPLEDVCEERAIDVSDFLRELEAAASVSKSDLHGWSDASLTDLCRHIESRYHVPLRAELGRVGSLLDKVVRVHGERHPELSRIASTFLALRDDLLPHMMKEECVLFPYVIRLQEVEGRGGTLAGPPFGTVAHPISVMLQEHEAAGELLAELRALTGGFLPPADACNSFRGLYHGLLEMERELHEHIHLENNVLFPRAIALEERLRSATPAA
jgi:regulator of cell morphogenesis and NO signaling